MLRLDATMIGRVLNVSYRVTIQIPINYLNSPATSPDEDTSTSVRTLGHYSSN